MTQELRQIIEGFLNSDATGLAGSKVRKSSDEKVFSSGDKGNFMYLIESGLIEIIHNEETLETVGAGGIVGEMALVDEAGRRSANAQVKQDAVLIPINRRRFRELVQRNPDFALEVMKVLARRIREMNERVG